MDNRKDYAVVFGITGNYVFALANVLIGIKKHCKNINFDIFVYHQNLGEKNKNLLNSIIECNFVEYIFPEIRKKIEEGKSLWLQKFSEFAFVRYECFDYLNNYKKAAWLDVDILVQNDLQALFDACENDIALYKEESSGIEGLFLKKVDFIDATQSFHYNTGILVMSETLLKKGNYKNWCYEKTVELADIVKLPDQAILNMMLQDFSDIKVSVLDKKFNCYPTKKDRNEAVILHSYNSEKFWNYHNIKEWNNNYREWLKMGGTPYNGPKHSFLYKFLKPYFCNIPDPLRRPRDFFKYVLGKYGV